MSENPDEGQLNRREFMVGAGSVAATGGRVGGAALEAGSLLGYAAIAGGALVLGDCIFTHEKAEAAGIKGTDTPEYKKAIVDFYKYMFETGPEAASFNARLNREGNLLKNGQSTSVTTVGNAKLRSNFQKLISNSPLLKEKNITDFTMNMIKQGENVMIILILQDKDGNTNTNTIIGRPKSAPSATE